MLIYLALLEQPDDEPAFIALYNKYLPSLFRIGMAFCGDFWLVEDALQMTWIDIAKSFSKISSISCQKLDAYLATIMRNNCRDILRTRKIHEEINADDMLATEDVFDEVYNKVEAERLVAAIRAMPEMYREVLERRLILGDGNKDIAKSLGIKESLVAKRYERGHAMLVSTITGEEEE